MSGNIDILLRLPDVAAIGRAKLQDYCNEWLERPIARQFGITHLIVGSDLMLTVNLNSDAPSGANVNIGLTISGGNIMNVASKAIQLMFVR